MSNQSRHHTNNTTEQFSAWVARSNDYINKMAAMTPAERKAEKKRLFLAAMKVETPGMTQYQEAISMANDYITTMNGLK